jgi:hypothetical protein
MSKRTVLSLKDFIRQAQTLKLFRDFLRKIRKVPDLSLQLQLRQEVKSQFRYNSQLVDSMAIKSAMIEASRSMKQIEALAAAPPSHHHHHHQSTSNHNSINTETIETGHQKSVDRSNSSNSSSEKEENYRVGTGWPWDR